MEFKWILEKEGRKEGKKVRSSSKDLKIKTGNRPVLLESEGGGR
jgi:hypothetical protein